MKKPVAHIQDTRWHRLPDQATMQQSVAEKIATLANQCIAARGSFHIVLAGGDTPRGLYRLLRTCHTDWKHWHVYFGDERCWPARHPGRNDTMAFENLLSHVPIPSAQIHPIPAELPQAEAVTRYSATLATVSEFDLVLLGVGEDGHTASLFPGHAWGRDAQAPAVMAVDQSPSEPEHRITLSAHRLSGASHVWFLVSGKRKEAILLRWQNGEFLPVSAIQPAHGIDIFIAP